MSSVARSWVRIFCTDCGERRTFLLGDRWVLRCESCGAEKAMDHGILVREERPVRRKPVRK